MPTSILTRRQFGGSAVAATVFSGLGAIPASAKSHYHRAGPFYLQHWSSTKLIHPYKGKPSRGDLDYDTPLVTYGTGTAPQAKYFFDFAEGPWGYIVSALDPKYCVHPAGGSVNAGNNTSLVFHTDRHPGAYFTINPETGTIRHISGRYWHPYGGSSQPKNNNRVVLFNNYSNSTKFVATTDGRVSNRYEIQYPANGSVGWKLLFAEDNPRSSREKTYTRRVGLIDESSQSSTTSVSIATEFSKKLFGGAVKGKLSIGVTSTFASEDSRTWSEETTLEEKYNVEKGVPIAVWQKIYRAEFDDGSEYQFFSGTVTCDTPSANQKPADDC